LQPTLLGERINLSNLYFPFEETGMSAVAELGRKRFLKTLHEISFLILLPLYASLDLSNIYALGMVIALLR
jgi:hypothetical protein